MGPEHIHLAINHIPVLGLAVSIIPLLAGLLLRNRTVLITGLVLAFICAWFTPLVIWSGEATYDRYEHGPVKAFLDPASEDYMEIHEHRAEAWSKTMYAAAVLSTLCLILAVKNSTYTDLVSWIVAVSCVIAVTAGIWIAKSGGEIRRVDFRDRQPAIEFDMDD